jgi:mono/diheme cytochrome c family protein
MIRVSLIGLLILAPLGLAAAAEDEIDFARQIRPLLSDKCFACHGPDEHARESGLRLDVRASALESDAFVPGNAAESELVRRITSKDPDQRMPPASFHKELTAEEIKLLTRWVAEGAAYQQHWSYRPLQRPQLPNIDHPQSKSPIDALILQQLQRRGLSFSQRADRITLCRRLHLDLLGMPPTQQELDQFLNDQSDDAWEKLVTRLLNDQRFGERMAVYWLDLVRYADTIGYHSDNYMEVSAYRDYVINAFNDNKPFDQFTIEQLAGDLLTEPTDEQLIASGYNRLLQTTEEGGAQAKEYVAIYAADRVRNVSGVWLGQTVGCAQCHDHKYDPITSRDFYSLAAFFADIQENAVGKRRPNFKVMTDADQAHIQALQERIAGLKLPQRLEVDTELAARVRAGQQAWEQQALLAAESDLSVWQSAPAATATATAGMTLTPQDDGTYLSTGANPDRSDYRYTIKATGTVRAVRLEVFPDDSFARKQGFSRGNGNFVLTDFSVTANDAEVKIGNAKASYEQAGWPIAHTFDDSETSGWAVDGHQKTAASYTAVFQFDQPIEFGDEQGTLVISMQHHSVYPKHNIGRFRISLTDQAAPDFGDQAPLPEQVLTALRVRADQRTAQQAKQVADHYLSFAAELTEAKKQLAASEQELADYEKNLPTMLVTQTVAQPRITRMLPRGDWLDDSGEVVQPAVPAFLPHEQIEDRRANRLDLANWIMDAENPLTARTFTNRLWKLYFGQGLSRNLDDLGGQGEPPTHPELLDWLAVEFRESGWDIKHMVRLLVTSATYQQTSVADEQLRRQDPDNRWYARQGRWRLEAEFIRDSALMLGRLLVTDKIGGRSVKPYQPAGYWQHLNFPARKWQADKGEKLYRRGLYTFWCRTFLHPTMLAFDASSREECIAQRARSNIPQQALVLLNDPMFVEAAKVFAGRIVAAAETPEQRVVWAFREATSRQPSPDEQALLVKLYETQRQRYAAAEQDAAALVSVGEAAAAEQAEVAELAAWTQVARAIINAYESTSRF